MEDLEKLYDTIKDYRGGCVLIFIEPAETLKNDFYIIDRCIEHLQKNCQHYITFTQISPTIYYANKLPHIVLNCLRKNYSKTRYILLDIESVNNPEENDTKTYSTETD